MSLGSFIAPPAPAAAHTPDGAFCETTLWAGDLVAERRRIRMATVLGSCVAVCLYDPARRFGGMNHYLVPRGGRSAIHGDWAIHHLVERMCTLGSDVAALQGKIFGGGRPLKLEHEQLAVGEANVAVARRLLGELGIPIVAERTGHGAGVRLFFENWTGVVWLRAHTEEKSP